MMPTPKCHKGDGISPPARVLSRAEATPVSRFECGDKQNPGTCCGSSPDDGLSGAGCRQEILGEFELLGLDEVITSEPPRRFG
jgi:hypothetical protein